MFLRNDAFFAAVRKSLFGGSLTSAQVAGTSAILDAWLKTGPDDPRKLAYVLATSFHEVGRTMQPIVENLSYSADALLKTFSRYFTAAEAKAYARQPERIANRAYANRMGNGNEASGDGWRYRGRGLVQLTGLDNYRKADAKLGLGGKLVVNPDLALDPAIAAQILVLGMIEGWFTGFGLDDFITNRAADYAGARRIINGRDKALLIAGYAEKFEAALLDAGAVTRQNIKLPTLKKNAIGSDVARLQNFLGIKTDGIFGSVTKKTVEAFQRAKDLKVDGVVGPTTWAALLNK